MVQKVTLPPTYEERIPSSSKRYDDKHAEYPKKRQIPIGNRLSSLAGDDEAAHPFTAVPDGWQEHVNPSEGQPFFYHKQRKIVTDSYIRFERVLARILACYDRISEVILSHDDGLNRLSDMDIYIELIDDRPSNTESCKYYLVDHSRHTICFLRQIDTSALGLPDVRNNIHLEHVLMGEYWTHCEYMPLPDVDMTMSAKKLQGQLAALMIDNISSEGSTSPFTPDECKNYLKGLENAVQPQMLNWSVARINSLLIQSQIVNLFGEECARPDRTVVVTGQHVSRRGPTYEYCSKVMFDCPSIHLDKLEHIWVERIIYTHHWRKLVADLLEEWTFALAAAGFVWIADAILLSTASSLVVILLLGTSTASIVFGGMKAVFLIRSHRAMGKYAAHGCQFLQSKEEYGKGLQSLSIEYSYPWACVLWSGCLTSLAVLWIVLSNLVGALVGMVSAFGYGFSYAAVTAFLGFGAWAYGKGYDIRSMPWVSSFSSPQRS